MYMHVNEGQTYMSPAVPVPSLYPSWVPWSEKLHKMLKYYLKISIIDSKMFVIRFQGGQTGFPCLFKTMYYVGVIKHS